MANPLKHAKVQKKFTTNHSFADSLVICAMLNLLFEQIDEKIFN